MKKEEFINKWAANGWNPMLMTDLESVIAKAIAEHEQMDRQILLKQFSNFLENHYPMNAAGIPFRKATELFLERFPQPYQEETK